MAVIEQESLISDRLLLRPYKENDTDLFHDLIRRNAERLAPAFPSRVRVTEQKSECLRLIKQFKADWHLGQTYAFGIWQKFSGIYLGEISLKNFDQTVPKAEVGYYLDTEAEGWGYGKEALQLIVFFAFQTLGVNKLFIKCALQNTRSFALAEACAFKREGLLHADFRDYEKNLIDVYYYGLTRADYIELAKLPSS